MLGASFLRRMQMCFKHEGAHFRLRARGTCANKAEMQKSRFLQKMLVILASSKFRYWTDGIQFIKTFVISYQSFIFASLTNLEKLAPKIVTLFLHTLYLRSPLRLFVCLCLRYIHLWYNTRDPPQPMFLCSICRQFYQRMTFRPALLHSWTSFTMSLGWRTQITTYVPFNCIGIWFSMP